MAEQLLIVQRGRVGGNPMDGELRAADNRAGIGEQELAAIRALIEERSGIVFDEPGQRAMPTRVREHMAFRRVTQTADLLRNVRHSSTEYEALLERLLSQETAFFRCPQAFDALEKHLLPELHMKKFWESPRSLRIWSAGCASGEEPYSIAITVAETLELADGWKVSILATDINRQALLHAERGVYALPQLAALSARQIESYFSRIGDQFMVKPRLRNLVSFSHLNLADDAYPGRFDCIFCMGVLRYIGAERRPALLRRFYDLLEPGGYLLVGDGENVADAPLGFVCVVHGKARVYHKPLGPARRLSEPVYARRFAQSW